MHFLGFFSWHQVRARRAHHRHVFQHSVPSVDPDDLRPALDAAGANQEIQAQIESTHTQLAYLRDQVEAGNGLAYTVRQIMAARSDDFLNYSDADILAMPVKKDGVDVGPLEGQGTVHAGDTVTIEWDADDDHWEVRIYHDTPAPSELSVLADPSGTTSSAAPSAAAATASATPEVTDITRGNPVTPMTAVGPNYALVVPPDKLETIVQFNRVFQRVIQGYDQDMAAVGMTGNVQFEKGFAELTDPTGVLPQMFGCSLDHISGGDWEITISFLGQEEKRWTIPQPSALEDFLADQIELLTGPKYHAAWAQHAFKVLDQSPLARHAPLRLIYPDGVDNQFGNNSQAAIGKFIDWYNANLPSGATPFVRGTSTLADVLPALVHEKELAQKEKQFPTSVEMPDEIYPLPSGSNTVLEMPEPDEMPNMDDTYSVLADMAGVDEEEPYTPAAKSRILSSFDGQVKTDIANLSGKLTDQDWTDIAMNMTNPPPTSGGIPMTAEAKDMMQLLKRLFFVKSMATDDPIDFNSLDLNSPNPPAGTQLRGKIRSLLADLPGSTNEQKLRRFVTSVSRRGMEYTHYLQYQEQNLARFTEQLDWTQNMLNNADFAVFGKLAFVQEQDFSVPRVYINYVDAVGQHQIAFDLHKDTLGVTVSGAEREFDLLTDEGRAEAERYVLELSQFFLKWNSGPAAQMYPKEKAFAMFEVSQDTELLSFLPDATTARYTAANNRTRITTPSGETFTCFTFGADYYLEPNNIDPTVPGATYLGRSANQFKAETYADFRTYVEGLKSELATRAGTQYEVAQAQAAVDAADAELRAPMDALEQELGQIAIPTQHYLNAWNLPQDHNHTGYNVFTRTLPGIGVNPGLTIGVGRTKTPGNNMVSVDVTDPSTGTTTQVQHPVGGNNTLFVTYENLYNPRTKQYESGVIPAGRGMTVDDVYQALSGKVETSFTALAGSTGNRKPPLFTPSPDPAAPQATPARNINTQQSRRIRRPKDTDPDGGGGRTSVRPRNSRRGKLRFEPVASEPAYAGAGRNPRLEAMMEESRTFASRGTLADIARDAEETYNLRVQVKPIRAGTDMARKAQLLVDNQYYPIRRASHYLEIEGQKAFVLQSGRGKNRRFSLLLETAQGQATQMARFAGASSSVRRPDAAYNAPRDVRGVRTFVPQGNFGGNTDYFLSPEGKLVSTREELRSRSGNQYARSFARDRASQMSTDRASVWSDFFEGHVLDNAKPGAYVRQGDQYFRVAGADAEGFLGRRVSKSRRFVGPGRDEFVDTIVNWETGQVYVREPQNDFNSLDGSVRIYVPAGGDFVVDAAKRTVNYYPYGPGTDAYTYTA